MYDLEIYSLRIIGEAELDVFDGLGAIQYKSETKKLKEISQVRHKLSNYSPKFFKKSEMTSTEFSMSSKVTF